MRRAYRHALRIICLLASIGLSLGAGSSVRADELRLELPDHREVTSTVAIVGWDDSAPRSLVLWHWTGEAFERLAETRSNVWGRFDFGRLPVPVRGWRLHVAEADHEPDRARLELLLGPLPAPRLSPAGFETDLLSIQPALFEGELRIYAHGDGGLLLRRSLAEHGARAIFLDLAEELPRSAPEALEIVHVLGDGRRSEPAYWRVAPGPRD